MGTWSKDEKVAVGAVALVAAFALTALAAMAINWATSEEISRDPPRKVPYTYCAQWQSAYRQQTCIRYDTGFETRVVVHKRGILWDYDTYEVIR